MITILLVSKRTVSEERLEDAAVSDVRLTDSECLSAVCPDEAAHLIVFLAVHVHLVDGSVGEYSVHSLGRSCYDAAQLHFACI